MNTQDLQSAIQIYFNQFPSNHYGKFQSILREDQPITHVYFLDTGYVREYIITPSGQELTLHIFRPGAIVGLTLILGNQPNKYHFQALTDAKLFAAPVKQTLDWLDQNPAIYQLLALKFTRAIRGLSLRLENTLFTTAYEKIINQLIYLATVFGEKNKWGQTILNPGFTHEDLASWLGLARETVSRQIEQLKSRDLITYFNHTLIIKDLDKLKEELKK